MTALVGGDDGDVVAAAVAVAEADEAVAADTADDESVIDGGEFAVDIVLADVRP